MAMNPRLLRPTSSFSPKSISGLALWLDGSDSSSLYTTDAGPVDAVSSPLDISGCQLWLDASDATTISDTAGAVDQWDDKSGNDNHATASTTARPTTGSTSQNGLNTLSFDGVANTLTIANDAAFNGSSLTYFIVAKQSAAANQSLLYKASATSGVNGFIFRFRTGTTVWLYQANDNAGATLSTATNTNTDMAIYAVTLAASSQGGFVSGARQASATASATYDDTGAIWIGSRRNIGEYLGGDVAEVLVYDTALTTSQRASVEAYLAAKWGISEVHAPATSGAPVGYWKDKSGNSRHATQATAASRPTVGSQNGRTALTANGTSHELSLANAVGIPRNKDGLTIIAALTPNTVSSIRTAAFWSVGTSTGARSLLQFNAAELRAGGRRLDADSFDSATGGTVTASQPIVAVARLDYANAIATAYGNSAIFANDSSFLAAGSVSDTDSQVAFAMSSGGQLYYSGTFAELLVYDRALTTSERRRAESYLARRWGITLAPQVSNVEAQDWVNRVYANGGTVSTSTANAVSAFCDAIEGAGIRDRFYRLNLFAGSNLNSALVPLFRGPSYSSDGLGSELWSVSTPTISDIGGSSGAWDGSTLTMSNSATGTDGSAPRFLFSLPLTVGKRYTVSGTISGDKSALAYIRLATSSNLTAITYNSTTGAFSGTAVTAATAGIQFLMNGTQGAKSISIDSLSIREVLTYGNATDTNNGPFVSGDYSESTGLQGNQTSKYLNTGLTYDDLSAQALAHLSVWKGAGSVGATLYMAGNIGPSTRNYWLRQNVSTDYIAGNIASGSIPTSSSADTDSGLLTISRQGSSNAASVIYKDTTAIATGTIGTQEVNGNDILIFTIAQANNTPSALGWPFTISAYSVGDGLTSGDLTSYYNALAAFQASLGRS